MTASAVPRWNAAITKAITEHQKSVVIQLASIDPLTAVPHVRSHIFREFLSPASNPSLPLLISTTDIRTPKIDQIIRNSHVQVAWWIEGTQEQFRISGVASAIPAPSNDLYKYFRYSMEKAAKGSALAALGKEQFDWEQKRKDVFKNMSGYMKATWCRPPPGTHLEGGYDDAKKWPVILEEPTEDDGETTRNWEFALGNFALLIIDPTEVDYLELGVVPNRRTRFWRTDGVWESEVLVP